MHLGYLGPTLVFGGISAIGFFIAQRKARKVKFFQQEELEVAQVKSAGVCKVHGIVVAKEPLLSPLTGKPVVWYACSFRNTCRPAATAAGPPSTTKPSARASR